MSRIAGHVPQSFLAAFTHTGKNDCPLCDGFCMPNPVMQGCPPAAGRGRAATTASAANTTPAFAIGGAPAPRKKTKMASQRSLERLRELGYQAAIVEKWNPNVQRPDGGKGIRVDLFGFADILAFRAPERVRRIGAPDHRDFLFVQATSFKGMREHVAKIRDNVSLAIWLRAGGRVEVWGWRRVGLEGARKRWKLERIELVINAGRVRPRMPA